MSQCVILQKKRRVAVMPAAPEATLPTPVPETARSVLSLHRTQLSAPDPAVAPAETKTAQGRPEKPKKRYSKKRLARLQTLRDHWPLLFSSVQPLKTGIKADLVADARERQLSLSEKDIGLCLRDWVNRAIYQKAVASGEMRFDLSGTPVEPISDADKIYVSTLLEAMETRWKRLRKSANQHQS
ncbi:ProQ/FINO family protein [Salmonella enterica]|uniref:ProQ/FINO family protein n=1 Tax=Salmonella enterica TaxID=28901 RepID=UPI00160067D8|nr:ProQ/FINO family protein [Salmonella enterica]